MNKITIASLTAAAVLLSLQATRAGSATWKSNPSSSDWNTTANWTPATVPNGPSNTATFNTSIKTAISLPGPTFTQLDGVIYNSGASAFTTTLSVGTDLSLEGLGITNNSGNTQTFVVEADLTGGYAEMNFSNGAAAGSSTSISTVGGQAAGQPAPTFNSSIRRVPAMAILSPMAAQSKAHSVASSISTITPTQPMARLPATAAPPATHRAA